MTSTFDFVQYLIPFAKENNMIELIETVLRTSLHNNTSKNYLNWINGKKLSGNFDEYDIDDLAEFFDDFHDLDHRHHHKVWSDTAYYILTQINAFFSDSRLKEMVGLVSERDFRSLRKYVPSFVEVFVLNYYKVSKGGYYILKGSVFDK